MKTRIVSLSRGAYTFIGIFRGGICPPLDVDVGMTAATRLRSRPPLRSSIGPIHTRRSHFTVADEHGNDIEKCVGRGPSPSRLANGGWAKESLKPGDQVTIVGNPNKNGSPTMRFVKEMTLPNGQELQARRHYF